MFIFEFSLQFRAFPRDIIMKVLKVLQELNIGWKKIGDYNMKCRWFPFQHRTQINANLKIGNEMNVDENDPHAKSSPVVKFELQVHSLIVVVLNESCAGIFFANCIIRFLLSIYILYLSRMLHHYFLFFNCGLNYSALQDHG